MVIVFGLAAAVLYGSADFLGGAATRQSRALSVASLSVPAGAVVMLLAAIVAGGPVPTAGLGWALAAGAFGAVGLIAFYNGLAVGPMSVVAPVSALVSTVLPVGVAVASGEHLSLRVYAGVAVCLAAIVLVSLERGAWPRRGRPAGRGPVTAPSRGAAGIGLRGRVRHPVRHLLRVPALRRHVRCLLAGRHRPAGELRRRAGRRGAGQGQATRAGRWRAGAGGRRRLRRARLLCEPFLRPGHQSRACSASRSCSRPCIQA